MKLLSIIIPIYNVEKYIEKCLRSLEYQDIPKEKYEILCINDGSVDKSCEIVLKVQKEFENIILINQENQGVSRARNRGINCADGKYLLFIDPDDYVDHNSFNRVLHNAETRDAEVSFLGFTILNIDGTIRNRNFNEHHSNMVYKGIEAYYLSRGEGFNDPDRMWAVLLKSEFINFHNLRYLPNLPFLEDGELIARILSLANRCIFEGHSFYQRTTRPGSATNSDLFFSQKATSGFLLAASNLRNFRDHQLLNKQQKTFLNQPIAKFVLLAINSGAQWNRLKELKSIIKILKNSGFGRIEIEGCYQIYRFCGIVYNISPYLSIIALILYPKVYRYLKLISRLKKISKK